MRRPFALLAAAPLFALIACDEASKLQEPQCIESKTQVASLDTLLPDGRLARNAIGSALGKHALRFEHQAHPNPVSTFRPNSNGIQGSVELIYNAGGIYYVDSKAPAIPEGLATDLGCPNRVEVEVAVAFKSDDGAFAEAWNATLVQRDDNIDQSQPGGKKLTELKISLDQKPINGSFKLDPAPEFPPEKLERRDFQLLLNWDPQSFRGGELGATWTGKPVKSGDGSVSAVAGKLDIYKIHPITAEN